MNDELDWGVGGLFDGIIACFRPATNFQLDFSLILVAYVPLVRDPVLKIFRQ